MIMIELTPKLGGCGGVQIQPRGHLYTGAWYKEAVPISLMRLVSPFPMFEYQEAVISKYYHLSSPYITPVTFTATIIPNINAFRDSLNAQLR